MTIWWNICKNHDKEQEEKEYSHPMLNAQSLGHVSNHLSLTISRRLIEFGPSSRQQ